MFTQLTKENQRPKTNIKNKHGKKAVLLDPNWAQRGCWVYYKHKGKDGMNSGLIKYADFHNWKIEI